MSATAATAGADTVRIKVRARGTVPFPWAGRAWAPEEVEYDAHPNEVRDFMAAPRGALVVTWPEDYVAPDGTMPGRVVVAMAPQATPVSPAERLQHAEREAASARAGLIAAESEIAAMRARHTEEVRNLRGQLADVAERSGDAAKAIAEAEQRVVAAMQNADKAERDHRSALADVQARHVAEIDSLRAAHAEEMAKTLAEHDRAMSTLTAELDRATAPQGGKAKPKAAAASAAATAPAPPTP